MPFLGDIYGKCLDKGEIKLKFDEDGFNVCFMIGNFPCGWNPIQDSFQ